MPAIIIIFPHLMLPSMFLEETQEALTGPRLSILKKTKPRIMNKYQPEALVTSWV
jgi:hypothetical protein